MNSAGAWIRLVGVALVATLSACADDTRTLSVQVASDLVAGVDFGSVETLLIAPSAGGDYETLRRFNSDDVDISLRRESSFVVATIDNLRDGTHAILVRMRDLEGREILTRKMYVTLASDTVVTVHFHRACEAVMCPGSGVASATECVFGTCVDPECVPSDPSTWVPYCRGLALCEGTLDCSGVETSACASALCTDHVCTPVENAAPSGCGDNEYCDPQPAPRGGCLPTPVGMDAGVPGDGAVDGAAEDLSMDAADDGGVDAGALDMDVDSGAPACDSVCVVPTDPCTVGAWSCVTDACVAIGHLSAGTSCGAGGFCDDLGACSPCVEGALCTSPGVCGTGQQRCGTTPSCEMVGTASEVCNGVDDNCDGQIDEGLMRSYYIDADGDRVGSTMISSCAVPLSGVAFVGGDCSDSNASVYPGAPTVACNGIDEDCDGALDNDEDADADTFARAGCSTAMGIGSDCNDADPTIHPGATEVCDAIDQDCNAATPVGDQDGDHYRASTSACALTAGVMAGDCNDANATINPGASETCNGRDDDCDGMIDDGGNAWCDASVGAAHASGVCMSGMCSLGTCDSGYADCVAGAGCESELAVSQQHCGMCGNACDWPLCAAGSCHDTVISVDVSYRETCVVRADGVPMCAGAGFRGGLGDSWSGTLPRPFFHAVSGITDAVEVSVNFGALESNANTACVRRSGGQLACWGANVWGQLGAGDTTDRSSPVAVAGISGVDELDVCSGYVCARIGGTVRCWGINEYGQLGSGTASATPTSSAAASVPVAGLTDAVQVSCDSSDGMTCAVRATGAVVCWGFNGHNYNRFGDGTDAWMNATPVSVVGLLGSATEVNVSQWTSCARLTDGRVQCWGRNYRGGLGTGEVNTTNSLVADVPVVSLSDAVHLFGSGETVCATRAAGAVVCWGASVDGAYTANLVPWTAYSGTLGSSYALMLGGCITDSSQRLRCWGYNIDGCLADSALGDTIVTPRATVVLP